MVATPPCNFSEADIARGTHHFAEWANAQAGRLSENWERHESATGPMRVNDRTGKQLDHGGSYIVIASANHFLAEAISIKIRRRTLCAVDFSSWCMALEQHCSA